MRVRGDEMRVVDDRVKEEGQLSQGGEGKR